MKTAPKHRKRQQLKKRLRSYVSVTVTTDEKGTRGQSAQRDKRSGEVTARESATLSGLTGDVKLVEREYDSIASTGTQAITMTVRNDQRSRRNARQFQRVLGYRLLNNAEPIQVIGDKATYGIGLRGFHPGTALTDEIVDRIKRLTWVLSLFVACRSLSGNGMEYRRNQDQLAANKRDAKRHDPLRKRSGNWGG